MNDLDSEYAIRQDVRNNPIRREVDRARVVEMWRWAAVLAGFGVVLVFSAWQHFQVLQNGYRIEDMRRQRVAEEEIRRHLMLERAALLRPQRIERVAKDQLHLVTPSRQSTIVIERVTTGDPPARDVVAAAR